MYFAAQYPARAYPCQRFAHTLSNVHASLGAAVAGYAFNV